MRPLRTLLPFEHSLADTVVERRDPFGTDLAALNFLRETTHREGVSALEAFDRLSPAEKAATGGLLRFSNRDTVTLTPPNTVAIAFEEFTAHRQRGTSLFGTMPALGINVDSLEVPVAPDYDEATAIDEYTSKPITTIFADAKTLVKHITAKDQGEFFVAIHPRTGHLILIDSSTTRSAPTFAALHIIVTDGCLSVLGRDSGSHQTNWLDLDPTHWQLTDESERLTALSLGTNIMAAPFNPIQNFPAHLTQYAEALLYASQYLLVRKHPRVLAELLRAAHARAGTVENHRTETGDHEGLTDFIHRAVAQYDIRSFGLRIEDATKLTAMMCDNHRQLPPGCNVYFSFPVDKPPTIMMRENGSTHWINFTRLTAQSKIAVLFSNEGFAQFLGTCAVDADLSAQKEDQLKETCRELVDLISQTALRHSVYTRQRNFISDLNTRAKDWPTDQLIAEIGRYAHENGVQYDGTPFCIFADRLILAKRQLFQSIIDFSQDRIASLSEAATDLFSRALQDYAMHFIYLWLAENTILNSTPPIATRLELMAIALANSVLPAFGDPHVIEELLDFCSKATANGKQYSTVDVRQAVEILKNMPPAPISFEGVT